MRNLLIVLSFICLNNIAFADQNIEIIGGNNASNPKIAIIQLTGETEDKNISDIITNDLNVTGQFSVTKYPNKSSVSKDTKFIVTGTLDTSNNAYKVDYNLNSTSESKGLLLNQNLNDADLRKLAHTMSNAIYQKITNTPGIFNTKIAYITNSNDKYNLVVSDYDGFNQQVIVSSHYPLSSIAWDKSGRQIAYVSFETGKPVVYVQDLYDTKRYLIANFKGSNSSPAFIPDASRLAVTLTKDHGSHIYLVNNSANNMGASNLIKYGNIDTEAAISDNGQILFTSDHDGGPQIFLTNLSSPNSITRVTNNLGKYNTTARWSHDNSKLVFINRNIGTLRTYLLDLTTKSAYPISVTTTQDLAPSFAPNDKLVLFSSNNSIYITNSTGTTQTQLKNIQAETIIDQRWANNF